jgi:hypothetical protein
VLEATGEALAARVIPPALALPHLPRIALTDEQARAVRNGRQPPAEWFAGAGEGPLARLVEAEDLVAVAARGDDGTWRLDTVLPAVGDRDDPSCA